MTRRGILLLFVGPAVLVAGWLARLPTLVELGAAPLIAMMLVFPILGRKPFGHLRVGSLPSRVARGNDVRFRFGFSVTGSRRWLWIEEGHLRSPARVFPVGRGAGFVEYVLDTSRRGVVEIGPFRLVQRDPFGLIRRTAARVAGTKITVQPRVYTPDVPKALALALAAGDDATPAAVSGDEHFLALREYVLGDDPRTIHWRSSARVGELVVRQSVATVSRGTIVVLDVDSTAYSVDPMAGGSSSAELFEASIDLAASVAAVAAGHGTVHVVTTGKAAPVFAGSEADLNPVLDGLAGVQLSQPLATAPEGMGLLARLTSSGRVVVISGSPGHRLLPAALACHNAGLSVTVLTTSTTRRMASTGIRLIELDLMRSAR